MLTAHFVGLGYVGDGNSCINSYLQTMANETLTPSNIENILANASSFLLEPLRFNRVDTTSLVTLLNHTFQV